MSRKFTLIDALQKMLGIRNGEAFQEKLKEITRKVLDEPMNPEVLAYMESIRSEELAEIAELKEHFDRVVIAGARRMAIGMDMEREKSFDSASSKIDLPSTDMLFIEYDILRQISSVFRQATAGLSKDEIL